MQWVFGELSSNRRTYRHAADGHVPLRQRFMYRLDISTSERESEVGLPLALNMRRGRKATGDRGRGGPQGRGSVCSHIIMYFKPYEFLSELKIGEILIEKQCFKPMQVHDDVP